MSVYGRLPRVDYRLLNATGARCFRRSGAARIETPLYSLRWALCARNKERVVRTLF
jgi:hypothetical protein